MTQGFGPCNRDWLALNVFVALCYCNMDYYDVSLEILDIYLQVCLRHMLSLTGGIVATCFDL